MKPIVVAIIIILLLVVGFFFVKPMLTSKEGTKQVGEERLEQNGEEGEKQVGGEQVKTEIGKPEEKKVSDKNKDETACKDINFKIRNDACIALIPSSQIHYIRVSIENNGIDNFEPILKIYESKDTVKEVNFGMVEGFNNQTKTFDIGLLTPKAIEAVPKIIIDDKEILCSDTIQKIGDLTTILPFCNEKKEEKTLCIATKLIDMNPKGDYPQEKINGITDYSLWGGSSGGGSSYICNVDGTIPSSGIRLDITAVENWVNGLEAGMFFAKVDKIGNIINSNPDVYCDLPYRKCLGIGEYVEAEKDTPLTNEPHPHLKIVVKHSDGIYDTKEVTIKVIKG